MRAKEAVASHPGDGEAVGDLKEGGGALALIGLGGGVPQAHEVGTVFRCETEQGHGDLHETGAAGGRRQ